MMNAALLTATSLIMQSVSMAFNIYISNKVGAEGIGLFTLIMSVYGLCVTFATSGVHLASVRLVSEAIGRNSPRQILASIKRCFIYALIFGVTTGSAVFFLADYIGQVWLADTRTVRCIRILAVSLPFVSLSCVMSGYFSAVKRVFKSASAQVLEELITIGLVSAGLYFLLPRGIEYGCIAIIGGNCLAQVLSLIYMAVLFLLDVKKHNTREGTVPPALTRDMLGITLPVAFTAYAKSGLSTIKNLLIPYGLKKNGATGTGALEAYGMLTGMAFPVIMFPQVIIASFSGLLVPEITKSRVAGHFNNVRYIMSRVFHVVTVFSIGICGILICFAFDLGEVIYSNADVSLYIKLMAPLVPFLYIDSIVDATLNGLNEQVRSMQINLIDSMLSITLVWLLLPKMGTYGYILMLYVCKSINAAMSFARLIKVTGFRINVVKWFLKPALCIAVSVLAVKLAFAAAGFGAVYGTALTVIKIISAAVLYVVLIRLSLCVDHDDCVWFGRLIFGDKINFDKLCFKFRR